MESARKEKEVARQRQQEFIEITKQMRSKSPRKVLAAVSSGSTSSGGLAPLVGDLTPSTSSSQLGQGGRRRSSQEGKGALFTQGRTALLGQQQQIASPDALQAQAERAERMRQLRKENESRERRILETELAKLKRSADANALSPNSTAGGSAAEDGESSALSGRARTLAAMREEERKARLENAAQNRAKEAELRLAAQQFVAEKVGGSAPTYERMEARYNNQVVLPEIAKQRETLEARRERMEANRFEQKAIQAHAARVEEAKAKIAARLAEKRALEAAGYTKDDEEAANASDGEGNIRRKVAPPKVYVGRAMAQVREEDKRRQLEKVLDEERLRDRLLRAREYAAHVPAPPTDVTKVEQVEKARERSLKREVEERRRRGEEALKGVDGHPYVPEGRGAGARRRGSGAGAAGKSGPAGGGEGEKKGIGAGLSKHYRNYLQELREGREANGAAGEVPERKAKPAAGDAAAANAAGEAKEVAISQAKALEEQATALERRADALERAQSKQVASGSALANAAIITGNSEIDKLRMEAIEAKLNALNLRVGPGGASVSQADAAGVDVADSSVASVTAGGSV